MKLTRSFSAIAALALALPVCTSPALIAQGPPPPSHYAPGYAPGWDAPPAEYHEIERRGFADGIQGARKDFDNHRMPNVNNRDEYRHPKVHHEDRDAYRAAFRRGYDSGVEHFGHGNHY